MSEGVERWLILDGPPLLAALLAALACAWLGNGLVLRREGMLADALSHSVLPGLVGAFLLTHTREPVAMLAGGTAAGLLSVACVRGLERVRGFDRGTAIAATFPTFFALGVFLLEARLTGDVDLDPSHVLNGQLELLFWSPPDAGPTGLLEVLAGLPRQVSTLAALLAVALGFTAILSKELELAAFDPDLARLAGLRPDLLRWLHAALTAAVAVAAFEAVGTILTIALFLCPPAAARLCTNDYRHQHGLSLGFAATAALVGTQFAAHVPPTAFGTASWNAAGSVAATAGFLLALAARFGSCARGAGSPPARVARSRKGLAS